jgi:hypothetical protein
MFKKNKRRNLGILLFLTCFLLFVLLNINSFVQAETTHKKLELDWPNSPLGTSLNNESTIGILVKYIYEWGIGIGVLAFFGVLVFSGVQYLTASGDPSKVNSAIARIRNSLLGLGLLFGSYLILNTINPALTSFKDLPFNQVLNSYTNQLALGDKSKEIKKIRIYSEKNYQGDFRVIDVESGWQGYKVLITESGKTRTDNCLESNEWSIDNARERECLPFKGKDLSIQFIGTRTRLDEAKEELEISEKNNNQAGIKRLTEEIEKLDGTLLAIKRVELEEAKSKNLSVEIVQSISREIIELKELIKENDKNGSEYVIEGPNAGNVVVEFYAPMITDFLFFSNNDPCSVPLGRPGSITSKDIYSTIGLSGSERPISCIGIYDPLNRTASPGETEIPIPSINDEPEDPSKVVEYYVLYSKENYQGEEIRFESYPYNRLEKSLPDEIKESREISVKFFNSNNEEIEGEIYLKELAIYAGKRCDYVQDAGKIRRSSPNIYRDYYGSREENIHCVSLIAPDEAFLKKDADE